MKFVKIRKARLDDFRMFQLLYRVNGFQLLYLSPKAEYDDIEKTKEMIYNLGFDMNMIDEYFSSCSLKEYKTYMRNTYMIILNDELVCGYIIISRNSTKKFVQIDDLTCLLESIIGHRELRKIFFELQKYENASEFRAFVSNPRLRYLMSNIGFYFKGMKGRLSV